MHLCLAYRLECCTELILDTGRGKRVTHYLVHQRRAYTEMIVDKRVFSEMLLSSLQYAYTDTTTERVQRGYKEHRYRTCGNILIDARAFRL